MMKCLKKNAEKLRKCNLQAMMMFVFLNSFLGFFLFKHISLVGFSLAAQFTLLLDMFVPEFILATRACCVPPHISQVLPYRPCASNTTCRSRKRASIHTPLSLSPSLTHTHTDLKINPHHRQSC